jgi:hypothetical protein
MAATVAGYVMVTLAAAGCSSDASTSAGQKRSVGSAELNLTLPDNTTIDTVTYTVTQAGAPYSTGSIPVTNSSTLTFQVGNLPAGAGYTMSLSATTSGAQTCSAGPTPFSIMPSNATLIMMTLRCGGGTAASNKGNVRVDVDVVTGSTCAEVDGLTVIPRSVNVGSSMSLTGFATVATGVTYGWTVDAGGTFSPANAAMTSFTCTAPGMHNVTLSVSSGGTCATSTEDVPVICTGAGAAGTGAAGTGVAGTGVAGTGVAGTGVAGTGAAGTGVAGTGVAGTGVAGTGVAGTGVAGTGVAGTGVAGTGVAGTGAAGTGAAGTGSTSMACTTCEAAQPVCLQRQMDCDNIAGAIGGVAKSAICHQVIDCVRTSKCASAGDTDSPSDCLCGVNADVDTCASQTIDQVTGACKTIIATGTEATTLADMTTRLGDPDYATGLAMRLILCDQRFCGLVAPGMNECSY